MLLKFELEKMDKIPHPPGRIGWKTKVMRKGEDQGSCIKEKKERKTEEKEKEQTYRGAKEK
jgi:hypothetical protein